MLAKNLTNPYAVAADAATLYFVTGGAVVGCPLSGCVGAPTPFATGMTLVSSLVVSNGFLYWSESFSKAIWRYPLLPTPATPQKLVGDLSGPSTLLVDATSIVFDQSGDESGTIAKVPIGGASVPTPIASMNTFERGIAGDAKSIFVALDDSIVEIDRATGAKKVLARGAFFARGIAVDEKAVYFTNRNGVMKVVR